MPPSSAIIGNLVSGRTAMYPSSAIICNSLASED